MHAAALSAERQVLSWRLTWPVSCRMGLAKELQADNQKLMSENRRVTDRCASCGHQV